MGIGSEFVWLKLRSARAGFSLSSKSLKRGLFQVFSKNFFLKVSTGQTINLDDKSLFFEDFFVFVFSMKKCNQKFFVVRSVKICIVCLSCLPQSVKQSSDVILKKVLKMNFSHLTIFSRVKSKEQFQVNCKCIFEK